MPKKHESTPKANLYEFPLLRKITGDTLRPGGLSITADALERCAFPANSRLLDVGCGAGATLAFLRERGFLPVGVDMSLPLLGEAQQNAPVLVADAHGLPFVNGAFQGVLCECVVSLFQDAERAFREMARVLAPEGWLVVSDIIRLDGPEKYAPEVTSCCHGASAQIPPLDHDVGYQKNMFPEQAAVFEKKPGEENGSVVIGPLEHPAVFAQEGRPVAPTGSDPLTPGEANAKTVVPTCWGDAEMASEVSGTKNAVNEEMVLEGGKGGAWKKADAAFGENSLANTCLQGAKTRNEMEGLFAGAGCVLRHVIDYRKALVAMSAKMVWEFGSIEAFWELWKGHSACGCQGVPGAQHLGYQLFIGQKKKREQTGLLF